MTTSEIEAWLKATYPDKHFTVFDQQVGLPMPDGIMLYVRTDGTIPLKQQAAHLVAMVTGKAMPCD